jgi:CubicO group peptidase (beta-lactamase class C family)
VLTPARLRAAVVVALALAPAAAGAQSQLPAPLTARVDSAIAAAVDAGETAGVSVALARGDRVVYANGFGAGTVAPRRPATEGTVYRIGSLTAQFTAAAVLQLVDDGRLSLDDEVAKHLPGYPAQGRRVLVRHLLEHTSGIANYTALGPRWERTMTRDLPPDSVIAIFSGQPFAFEPGTQFRYNNSGYFLLGAIIERVSGQPYAEYVRRQLAEPLGLETLHYCGTRDAAASADGYAAANGRFTAAAPVSMTQPFSAGALCASAPDLARWPALLASGRLFPAPLYRRMTSPDTLSDGRVVDYGWGVGVRTFAGRRVIEHGGGINGFAGYLAHFPADSLTIAVLANTQSFDAQRLERALARLLLPGAGPRDLPLTAREQKAYAGDYLLGDHLPVRVWVERGRLTAQARGQPPFALLHQGGGVFAAGYDPEVTLAFTAPGGRAVSFELRETGRTTVATRRGR